MTMGRPWGLLSWKKYREWAWGPRSNWWMPARNWSSPNSCSVGQDSSVIGDKAQVLKVSYLKSTLSRLYLLHKKPHHSHQLACFFLEQARPFDNSRPPADSRQSMRFARPWRLGLALVAAEPCQAAPSFSHLNGHQFRLYFIYFYCSVPWFSPFSDTVGESSTMGDRLWDIDIVGCLAKNFFDTWSCLNLGYV